METIQEMTDESHKGSISGGLASNCSEGSQQGDGIEPSRNIHTRTPMGDYIVPKGGKPLTHQAFPSPGPGDYLPSHQLTRRSWPHYSIVGRSKPVGENKPAPGPADYNTSKELIWTDKKVALKGKGKTMITEEAIDPTNTIGPAQYNVRYLNTGKHAPKLSVSSRHKDGVNVGHPSNALCGTRNPDCPTPGPNAYTPQITDKGHQKSFGVLDKRGRMNQDAGTLGPGPAAYNVEELDTKPGYSLGKRLKPQWQCVSDTPAPNSYNVASKIGKGLAMSIRSRQPYIAKTFGPSPNSYFLRDAIKHSDAPCAAITYRPFEPEKKPHPGPTHYSINNKTLRKAPCYSFRGICKYPVTQLVPEDTPGPGTYQQPRVFTENDYPAYTMGKRTKDVSNARPDGPGPNHYNIAVRHRPDGKKAPSFTMAGRSHRPQQSDVPAPTAYMPELDTNSGPKYSMTSRHTKKTKSSDPAPNSYNISMNQTVKGSFNGPMATLKGRNTRFVYQGYAFQNSVRLRDA